MKNIIYNMLLLTTCWIISTGQVQGQTYDFNNEAMRAIADDESTRGWVTIREGLQLPVVDFWSEYGNAFGLSDMEYMVLTKENNELSRFQMTYNGVEVEDIIASLHHDGEMVQKVTGPIVSGLSVGVTPTLSLDNARQTAISSMDVDIYMWQDTAEENLLKEIKDDITATFYPEGKLVLAALPDSDLLNPQNYKLAWCFEVYTKQPERAERVYIDALNGSVIKTDNLISSCGFDLEGASQPVKENTSESSLLLPPTYHTGPACTLYDGNQVITTELRPTGYRLADATRTRYVYTTLDGLCPYDSDNIWTTNCEATSAHWAAQQTYDYYLQEHGRLSYDGAGGMMFNRVESGLCDNAAWNSYWTTYGNGCTDANDFLVSLDVVGHEWAHAVTETSADLVYAGESGCLNESFSDIFGTMLDFYAGDGDYLIGEDMWIADGKLRDMSDPKSKNNPDTYLGQYWSTNVHNGSGVPNHWFYLLAEGSATTDQINDFGDVFSVSGIGKQKAAAIAYRCLTVYLTPTSNFADARQGTIEAAKDLFGICSNEVIQTAAAWDAVNVKRPATIAVNADVCGNFWDITNPNVYIASQTLRAGNICSLGHTTVHINGTLVMKAGSSVELHPGFTAKTGSYFHAYIMTCASGSYLVPPPPSQIASSSINDDPVPQEIERRLLDDDLAPPTLIASTELTVQPNPFQDYTLVKFTLPVESQVSLAVFDTQGRLVHSLISNDIREQGTHSIPLDSSVMGPGIYYCRLQAGRTIKTCKLVVIP